jgi:hypothetical protein
VARCGPNTPKEGGTRNEEQLRATRPICVWKAGPAPIVVSVISSALLLSRELRRQCDRIRLEEALGWDTDLIERLAR